MQRIENKLIPIHDAAPGLERYKQFIEFCDDLADSFLERMQHDLSRRNDERAWQAVLWCRRYSEIVETVAGQAILRHAEQADTLSIIRVTDIRVLALLVRYGDKPHGLGYVFSGTHSNEDDRGKVVSGNSFSIILYGHGELAIVCKDTPLKQHLTTLLTPLLSLSLAVIIGSLPTSLESASRALAVYPPDVQVIGRGGASLRPVSELMHDHLIDLYDSAEGEYILRVLADLGLSQRRRITELLGISGSNNTITPADDFMEDIGRLDREDVYFALMTIQAAERGR